MKSRSIIAAAFLIISAACGIKGPPGPPEPVLPGPPEGFRLLGRESCTELTWKLSEPPPEGGYLVSRAKVDPEHPALYAFTDRKKLEPGDSGFIDCELEPGTSYIYRVSGLNTEGLAGEPTESKKIINLAPPPAPVGLVAMPGDRFIDLSWNMPAGFEGEISFQVYRAEEPEVFSTRPVNRMPVRDMSWSDGGLENDKTYMYRVRTVALFEGIPVMEGPPSETVEAVPKDRIAPLAPRGLSVMPVEKAVVLRWSPNREPDLAGYNIYRKIQGEAGFRRINEEPLRKAEYTDRPSAPRGTNVYYSVTAVDNASNPNESKRSDVEKVFIPRN